MEAKTIVAIGALLTALGGSLAGVIQAVKAGNNTEALFRHDRVEIAVLNAKVGLLMSKAGVTLDIDVEELKKALADREDTGSRWSPFPSAYAQNLPDTSAGFPVVINGCNCVCPANPVVEPPDTPTVKKPIQTDQQLFEKLLKDQVKQAPKSLQQLEAH